MEIQKLENSIETTDPIAIRKKLAGLFETFLVARMQQGQVEPEAAKTTAQQFVEIFQNATSLEAQKEAIGLLEKDENPLLHNFALRVQEMNEVQVRHNLYQFMLEIAQKGDISGARSLYQLFDTGEIQGVESLQKLITSRQNSLSLKDAAQTLKVTLENNKLTAAATQLDQLIQTGDIQTQADLAKWQALIPGHVPQERVNETPQKPILVSSTAQPTSNTAQMNQLQRLWEGVHRLDKKLRILLGLDN